MNTQWVLETHGDPISAVNHFIQNIWETSNLEGMLVQLNGSADQNPKPVWITDPQQLTKVNPFKPVMTLNAARLIPERINSHPGARYGAVLRPCEMRALEQISKNDSFSLDSLITICTDCLGTYPAGEFHWRAERKGSVDQLSQEALNFARLGGISAYRYRSACQMCSTPNATGADLNIAVLGLPVRKFILVEARDEATAREVQLDSHAAHDIDPDLISQRQHLLAKLAERHNRTRERVLQGLVDVLPADVDALVSHLEGCGKCQECMLACPICTVIFPRRKEDGSYLRDDIIRWLMSCAGCGICEQVCPNHLPLNAIFSYIRQQMSDPMGYLS